VKQAVGEPELGSLESVVASFQTLTPGYCAPIPESKIVRQKQQTSWRRKQSSANRSPPCWFPVSRENTGKFADFWLEIAKAPPLSEENSIAYQQNSLITKTGKICWRSGNLKRVTANLIRITGSRVLVPGLLSFKSTRSWSCRRRPARGRTHLPAPTTIWNEQSAAIVAP
jgi:hypothetical protein